MTGPSLTLEAEIAELRRRLAQREAELQIINSVQLGLAEHLDVQSIYDLVGDKIRDIFQAQVVMISTYDKQTETIEHRYAIERGERIYAPGRHSIRGFRIWVVETRQPVLVGANVAELAAQLGQTTLPGTITPKTWLGVPMIVGDQVTGILSLQDVDKENAFGESVVRLLQTLAASMSVALENARLWEKENLYRKTLERELEIGRDIQAGFLPKAIPQPEGWEILASLKSAREVAGDFYDVFELPEKRIGLVVADVCDKGLGAALFMTLFRSLLRAAANIDLCARRIRRRDLVRDAAQERDLVDQQLHCRKPRRHGHVRDRLFWDTRSAIKYLGLYQLWSPACLDYQQVWSQTGSRSDRSRSGHGTGRRVCHSGGGTGSWRSVVRLHRRVDRHGESRGQDFQPRGIDPASNPAALPVHAAGAGLGAGGSACRRHRAI